MTRVEGFVSGLLLMLPVLIYMTWRIIDNVQRVGARALWRHGWTPSVKDRSWWSRRYFERVDG